MTMPEGALDWTHSRACSSIGHAPIITLNKADCKSRIYIQMNMASMRVGMFA